MTDAFVGIDLGTTYSLVSVLEAGAPRVLPNALGESLTPSAVSVGEGGEILIGRVARARAATHPTRTALSFKRDMGTDRVFDLGGKQFRPEELSAFVLRQLKQDAEAALGATIAEAVVTVPAYFGELQRRATKEACELAELRVERIINEPTAAALAYGLQHRERELRAAVLDLGGGTFDVTILQIMEGVIEIQSSAGDVRLGGDDFDLALVTECMARVKASHGFDPAADPVWTARLRDACELAKRRLSIAGEASVALPAFGPRREDVELRLTLADAERLWEPLLDRVRAPIRRALRDAEARVEQVDEVLLVGGATRMPCVARIATQIFGRLPLRTLPPDEAVALGAAVQVALKRGDAAVEDVVVTDVAPFTLGIAVGSRVGQHQVAGLFAPILERGTVLPASRVQQFHTMADGQRSIQLEVFQGEHSLCRENQKLADYTIKGIPAGPAGQEAVEVRFTYDLNGILDVDVLVVSTKRTHTLVIERAQGRLSKEEVAASRKRMQAYKFHPRDSLPNVTMIARAEALYVELTGTQRDLLGQVLSQFRAVLASQDSASIEEARHTLARVLLDLGP